MFEDRERQNRIRESFGHWLVREGAFYATLVIATANAFLHLWDWKSRRDNAPVIDFIATNYDSIVFAAQILVVVLLAARIGVFGKRPIKCPPIGRRRRNINKTVEKFEAMWFWVWVTWVIFYAALLLETAAVSSPAQLHIDLAPKRGTLTTAPDSVRFALDSILAGVHADQALGKQAKGDLKGSHHGIDWEARASRATSSVAWPLPTNVFQVVLNFLNNLNGLMFVGLYLVMTRRPTGDLELRPPNPLPLGLALILLASVGEYVFAANAKPWEMNLWSLLASAFSAIALILLVGRLCGQYIRPPGAVTVSLAAYCVIQVGWPFYEHDRLLAAFVSILAMAFKIVLYFFVDYILRSGDLVYYIDRTIDRGTRVVDKGLPTVAPTLGEMHKRRHIEQLLSTEWRFPPWGTDNPNPRWPRLRVRGPSS